MRILLLGLSRIAKRRLLPALAGIPQVEAVDVASRSSRGMQEAPPRLRGRVYADYEEALATSDADLVYVSLINSLHVSWTRRALERGFHVVVDKPCAPTLAEAEALAETAVRRGRCLAEATIFGHHPQIDILNRALRDASPGPRRVSATFSFPPMAAGDFRYSRAAAGGSLSDLGPYAVATARLLLDGAPDQVFCRIVSKLEVDSAFVVMMTFSNGGALVGRFGFDTEYCNHVSVIAGGISAELDRIYTIPANMENQIVVRRNNTEERIGVPPADSFLLFLQKVIDAAGSGRHEPFAQDLLADAMLLERLRRSAGEA